MNEARTEELREELVAYLEARHDMIRLDKFGQAVREAETSAMLAGIIINNIE